MRTSKSLAHGGFTLVELLVALSILGVLMVSIIGLTGGVLDFSRRSDLKNQGLDDLNDAAGYVALNARRAMEFVEDSTGVTITYSGSTFDCTVNSPDGPCISMVVPVTNRSTAAITGYQLVAYRIVPMSEWKTNPGWDSTWNGQETPTLVEYRTDLSCPRPCSSTPPVPSSITATKESLVLPNMSLVDELGNSFSPFKFTGVNELTLSLRIRATGPSADYSLPAGGPLVFSVARRP